MSKGNSIFQEDEEVGGEMTRLRYAQIAFEVSLAIWEIEFETKNYVRSFFGIPR